MSARRVLLVNLQSFNEKKRRVRGVPDELYQTLEFLRNKAPSIRDRCDRLTDELDRLIERRSPLGRLRPHRRAA